MSRPAIPLLRWNNSTTSYEIALDPNQEPMAITPDSRAWHDRLNEMTAFSFHSRSGVHYSLRKETVQRGGSYWYGYRRVQGRVVKRYLGRDLALARLEEVAADFTKVQSADSAASSPPEDLPEPQQAVRMQKKSPTRERATRQRTPRSEVDRRSTGDGVAPNSAINRSSHLLLTTKFQVPRTPARLVNRPHLHQLLQRGLERPLTLITSPAGSGKTMTIGSWIQQQELPAAWLSLDANDNDLQQFWTYVLTALDRRYPGSADTALAMLQSPQTRGMTAVLRTLLNQLTAFPQEIVLILDDYHLITDPAIHDSLAQLLEHPPVQFHLYLLTRSEPLLPLLPRLRVYDQVNEILAPDLRFRQDEVATFLRDAMGLHLSDEVVDQLAVRVDGWAAGLQLAALSLRGHADPTRFVASFGGSHSHVLAYFGREVLERQPEAVQSFLLQTSVLDRLCGPLCDAITGQTNGQAMLEQLKQENLFLIPLDDERRWFRYHHLFADLLRHRLNQERGQQSAELHRRAARWLEQEGWIEEAVQHLLAASEPGEAGRVVQRAAQGMIMRGETFVLRRLLEQLPEQLILQDPHLSFSKACIHFIFGPLTQAEYLLDQLERTQAVSGGEDRALKGQIATYRAVIASMHSQGAEALAFSRQALENLPESDLFHRSGAIMTLGHAYRLQEQLRQASAAYSESSRLSFASGNLFFATMALGHDVVVLIPQGKLRQAADLCRQVIHLAETRGGTTSSLAAEAYSYLGLLLYEWNDLAEARLAFDKAIALGEQWDNIDDQLHGHVWRAMLYQAQGQSASAWEEVRLAESLIQQDQPFPWQPLLVSGMAARLALRQGRSAEALRWSQQHDFKRENFPFQEFTVYAQFNNLTFIRLLMGQEDYDEAERLIEQLLRMPDMEEKQGSVLELLVLLALTQLARDRSAQALKTLSQAIDPGMPENYTRIFIDEGTPMRSLLARLAEREPRGSARRRYLDGLLVAFEQHSGTSRLQFVEEAIIEPLSEREREVLHLLSQGLSNRDIARRLVVALSTVKTHMHHLFAKLQVTDRLQAVSRARELGLLEQQDHQKAQG
jgi:LuxR family maltose regulon positive regulatory protein